MTLKDLWDDCEPLSAEEVVLLTGCDQGVLPLSDSETYYGIDSQDRVFAFFQWKSEPRVVFMVYIFQPGKFGLKGQSKGRFANIRNVEELHDLASFRMGDLTIEP